MIVDTSALLAVLLEEDDSETYLDAMLDAERVRISAASAVELGIVAIIKAGADAELKIDLLLRRMDAEIVSVDAAQATFARSAFRTFGKGRHKAQLNFGDCFSYTLSKMSNEPLLYKGKDFARTDVISAL
ncbi:MAG: type II toxin-antitoxin system VapC family toxin [Alphaproteobacteria bacterium]|nr:type II toxin-antitoxin system VapC family toxin [Alphaproteobacteria bacterium]